MVEFRIRFSSRFVRAYNKKTHDEDDEVTKIRFVEWLSTFLTGKKKDQKSVSKCLDHLEELPLLPEHGFFAYKKKLSKMSKMSKMSS